MKRFRFTLMLLALAAALVLTGVGVPVLASRPDAPTYGMRGPYTVGTREFTIPDPVRPLDVAVWYPALNPSGAPEEVVYRVGLLSGPGRALLDAPPDASDGPYPLIVFSHGLSALNYLYAQYVEHLASHGFVVIAANHPGSTFFDVIRGDREGILISFARRPLEVLQQIDFAETLTASGGALEGMIDAGRTGVTGHSFGGYTALAAGGARLDLRELRDFCAETPGDMGCFWLESASLLATQRGLDAIPDALWPATTDPRVQAVVALAPSSGPFFGETGSAALTNPLMIIVGSQDAATIPERDAYPVYEAVGSDMKALVVFENGGHYLFVQCPPIALALGMFAQCVDSVWDMARAHDLTNHFATAFFRATLMGDAEAAAALDERAVDFVGIRYATTF